MPHAGKEEPSPPRAHVTAEDALELYALFEKNGIAVCIDGGWGVDALLGRQTRLHADLDIAIQHKDVPRVRELLEIRGYTDTARPDTRDCNFVLGDASGREVDVHSYTFDASGNLLYGIAYPPDSLTGTGTIDGHPVRCISLEWVIKFRENYAPDEGDIADVQLLYDTFGMSLPRNYTGRIRT
jgi:lincosamide nucleotidyltransferase A/C/D/E